MGIHGELPSGLLEDLREGMTYQQLEAKYGLTRYYVDKLVDELPVKEQVVGRGGKKEFYLEDDEYTVNHVESRRMKTASKQTITKEANEYLAELEQEIKRFSKDVGPVEPEQEVSPDNGKEDLVIHRTDEHFGEIVKDVHGNEVFNSKIAERRIRETFDWILAVAEARRDTGIEIENVHLLLGGDIVTNEAIYETQPHEIDEFINEQLNRATGVFDDQISRLSDMFSAVQVVCQAGNHGEFRVQSSSNKANADTLLYDRLEHMELAHNRGNVRFVKSDRKDFVNFKMRGHTAHLRHGDHVSNHIGTSSPQKDWRGFLLEHGFDIAYRGHFHTHKIEHVNGVPVVMGPSIKPPGEYAGTLSVFDDAMGYVHGVSDKNPIAWTEYTTYGDPR